MRGFSLLELSIVLVIIGLIAGGIVAGASMIRAAELRAVATEYDRYSIAVNTFRDKYLGYPGDLKNAGAFWGYPGDDITNCPATAGTGTETCDGDGNGLIDLTNASEYTEPFTFWQHLANAELVSGSFTGISGSGRNVHSIFDENIPSSKLSGSGWTMRLVDYSAGGNGYSYTYYYGNTFDFGCLPSNDSGVSCPSLTAAESWNIDKKVDDGLPAKGKVFGVRYSTCTNASGDADYDAEYLLSDDSVSCQLRFANIF